MRDANRAGAERGGRCARVVERVSGASAGEGERICDKRIQPLPVPTNPTRGGTRNRGNRTEDHCSPRDGSGWAEEGTAARHVDRYGSVCIRAVMQLGE